MDGQLQEDRKPHDDDFGEMLRLRAGVWKHAPESDEANAMNARADQLAFALSACLVARELPGVEFPPPETKEYGSFLCGGRAPDLREACDELVWLYGFRADAGGRRQFAIVECLIKAIVFCGALSPHPAQIETR